MLGKKEKKETQREGRVWHLMKHHPHNYEKSPVKLVQCKVSLVQHFCRCFVASYVVMRFISCDMTSGEMQDRLRLVPATRAVRLVFAVGLHTVV